MALRATKFNENGLETRYGFLVRSGRGRNRSGDVEAVTESDPDRAFGPMIVTRPFGRKAEST